MFILPFFHCLVFGQKFHLWWSPAGLIWDDEGVTYIFVTVFLLNQLAKQYHPDTNKSAGAAEKFQEISEAYEVCFVVFFFLSSKR